MRRPRFLSLAFVLVMAAARWRRPKSLEKIDDIAVGIADIGAAADEHAGAAIFFLIVTIPFTRLVDYLINRDKARTQAK